MPNGTDASEIAIAVFAHNEERHIAACLSQVAQGAAGLNAQVTVLANGCRDATAEEARRFAERCRRRNPEVDISVVEIALGDKANAWNSYVYEHAPRARLHVFVDGDTLPAAESFAALRDALDSDRHAQAAAGLPVGGRSARRWRAHILKKRSMPGPLYALRDAFLDRLRAQEIRLPVGLIGDDILIPILVRSELLTTDLDRSRVTPCQAATFSYTPFSYRRFDDWRLYVRRKLRNSERHFQNQLLIPRARRDGAGALPARIAEIYQTPEAGRLRPRRSLEFPWDVVALTRMRRANAAELAAVGTVGHTSRDGQPAPDPGAAS